MTRKLCAVLVVILMFAAFSVSAFAGPVANSQYRHKTVNGKSGMNLDELIMSRDVGETEQFIATITKPTGDETIFVKSYVVCGFTDYQDICIAVAVYDGSKDQYVYVSNNSVWDVSGLFSNEIPLHLGANRLKIVAFPKSEINNLKPGVNAQVTYFTVTVLKQSIKDRIIQGVLKVKDSVTGIFGN
ncbi:MAG TPA: hypothetical protein GXX36_07505 [Clostridiaceae bacterium]|nr:hypothetical protein [Clostridiaceae bacterium]